MTKDDNINIFNDTLEKIEKSKTLTEAVNKSNENQHYISFFLKYNPNRFTESAKIIVSKSSTLDAARKYDNVAVLNFASATNPGGGVTRGSFAQEECICRCSTLYKNLNTEKSMNSFYEPHRNGLSPLHNDDIIYTPGVVVIKSDDYKDLLVNKQVNVITCAAPNLREKPQNEYNHESHTEQAIISDEDLLKLHIVRARHILNVAAAYENDNVILGAFGCGAFMNDPKIVAEAYKIVLPEFEHCFKTIEFAIYCKTESTNYNTFKNILL